MQYSKKCTIQVKFVDWHKDGIDLKGDVVNNYVLEALEKYYNVIISNKPDIVFCGIYGYEYKKYDCIRVFVCLEENIPNFNVYDYAITLCKGITYQDRIFSDTAAIFSDLAKELHNLALVKHHFSDEDFASKNSFCSFVQSHSHGTALFRTEIFHELSKYKKVDSGGSLLNNVGGPVLNKLEFEMRHKFSLSCYNTSNNTLQDRPTDAFSAKTVPIFWGNPDIEEIFNEGSFVNCHRFKDLNSLIDYIKTIDNDDELYYKMLRVPAFKFPETAESIQNRFEEFLINIVENGTKQRGGGIWNLREEEIHFIGIKRITNKMEIAGALATIFKPINHSKIGRKIRYNLLKY